MRWYNPIITKQLDGTIDRLNLFNKNDVGSFNFLQIELVEASIVRQS